MEKKKNEALKLEHARKHFFILGLCFSLSFVWMAMEYKDYGRELTDLGEIGVDIEEVEVPPIVRLEEPIQPKPKLKQPESQSQSSLSDLFKVDDSFEGETKEIMELDDFEGLDFGDMEGEGDLFIPELTEVRMPFNRLTKRPIFPGCEGLEGEEQVACTEQMIVNYIKRNFQYPDVLAQYGPVSGELSIQFVIDENGKIEEATVLKGRHKLLDKEGVRVVKTLPQMTAGEYNKLKVKTVYIVPIDVKVNN